MAKPPSSSTDKTKIAGKHPDIPGNNPKPTKAAGTESGQTGNTPRVLLLEPDPEYGQQLKETLELKHYIVDLESISESALKRCETKKYDVIVCDRNPVGLSAEDFIKQVRSKNERTPFLYLAQTRDDHEMVMAYCAGADDYLVKPFTSTELSLRIHALLKRSKPGKSGALPSMVSFGLYTFDYPNRLLCSPSYQVQLTKKEAEVLRLLAATPNQVVKREKVLIEVWGENDYFMGRSMDVYIARLRKKLAADHNVAIVNIHRMGFKLEVNGH
ncbi:MAG: DNA-binding response regulator [Bacteroidetes bacterium]|nr:MAG: DNA-binding response regulator [Bacteroidota bacterium]